MFVTPFREEALRLDEVTSEPYKCNQEACNDDEACEDDCPDALAAHEFVITELESALVRAYNQGVEDVAEDCEDPSILALKIKEGEIESPSKEGMSDEV